MIYKHKTGILLKRVTKPVIKLFIFITYNKGRTRLSGIPSLITAIGHTNIGKGCYKYDRGITFFPVSFKFIQVFYRVITGSTPGGA
jgi:hypothetical protein